MPPEGNPCSMSYVRTPINDKIYVIVVSTTPTFIYLNMCYVLQILNYVLYSCSLIINLKRRESSPQKEPA